MLIHIIDQATVEALKLQASRCSYKDLIILETCFQNDELFSAIQRLQD